MQTIYLQTTLYKKRASKVKDRYLTNKKGRFSCCACKRILTKRRAFKLGRKAYCPSDYFQAIKRLEKEDPRAFQLEVERIEKGKAKVRGRG